MAYRFSQAFQIHLFNINLTFCKEVWHNKACFLIIPGASCPMWWSPFTLTLGTPKFSFFDILYHNPHLHFGFSALFHDDFLRVCRYCLGWKLFSFRIFELTIVLVMVNKREAILVLDLMYMSGLPSSLWKFVESSAVSLFLDGVGICSWVILLKHFHL